VSIVFDGKIYNRLKNLVGSFIRASGLMYGSKRHSGKLDGLGLRLHYNPGLLRHGVPELSVETPERHTQSLWTIM
jgi:hypothetical protein